jgi:hypothetical protein
LLAKGKPVSTFPDHALAAGQREETLRLSNNAKGTPATSKAALAGF